MRSYTKKLGRAPRSFDPRVPHLGMMKAMLRVAPPRPPLLSKVDNAAKLPTSLGMMLNDSLGDCTCAGIYHGVQVHTGEALGAPLTEPDACVLRLYQEAAGYRPGDPMTDRGAVEQDVLNYCLNTGFPLADGTRHRLLAYVEVDTRHLDDVCEVIQEFGFAYIGFEVPSGFMETGPTNVWDVLPSFGAIEAGHCVILSGFDRTDPANPTFNVVSWGTRQWVMTAAFFRKYVDEAYGLVSSYWIGQGGKTPYDLTLVQLDSLADALREPGVAGAVDHGALEAAKYGVTRNPRWSEIEHEVRAKMPTCWACDPTTSIDHVGLQVHHMQVSFHVAVLLGRPDLEMDERNLCVLGEAEEGAQAPNHHLLLGHAGDFRRDCNPTIKTDVATFRGMSTAAIKADPRWQVIAEAAPPPWGEWTREMKIARREWLDVNLPPDPAVAARFAGATPVSYDAWLAALPA